MKRRFAVAAALTVAALCAFAHSAHCAVLFGDQTVEPKTDYNAAGTAEAFVSTSTLLGTVASISVYVDAASTATSVSVGLYSDAGAHPGTLLTSGTLSAPAAGAWNTVIVPAASVTAGTNYWIALLGSAGTLRFRDRCCGGGTSAEVSSQTTLASLPGTWTSGARYADGPASVYASTIDGPVLSVAPQSLALSATVGGPGSTGSLSIANGGGGALSWTATTSTPWLSLSSASGTAPSAVTVAASATGLSAGTFSGSVVVTAGGAAGSPATVPVTLTVSAPDTTAPTVSITAPIGGATVGGTTSVAATAADDVAVAGVQFKLDGVTLGSEVTTAPYSLAWDTTAATAGTHTLTAVARDAAGNTTTSSAVTISVDNTGSGTAFLGGDQVVEPGSDFNSAGVTEAFQTTASTSGAATQLQVYVDTLSTATMIAAGLYADASGHPGALLAQGTLLSPTAGAWSAVSIASTTVTAGTKYWIALLSPAGSGTLRFRDRCCGGGSPAETAAQTSLTTLPGTWTTGGSYKDGPVPAWIAGAGASGPPADQVGRWSAPQTWPLVAVHMALLPTGNVVMFDGFAAAPNSERIWNPTTGSFIGVPYGRNLFCAGQILLPDGKVLVAGGHVAAYAGLADTTLFDPSTNTWTRAQDMNAARWYPTVVELGDGRALVYSGDNITQDIPNQTPPLTDQAVDSLPEVFDPTTARWTALTGARLSTPLYPFLFTLSDGRVLDAGPDLTTRVLDPRTWTWSAIGTSAIDGMSAVMYRPDKILKSGSWAEPDFKGTTGYAPTNRAMVLDMSQPFPTWRDTGAMNAGRSYHDLTVLPDGNVLTTGGEAWSDGVDLSRAVLSAELWNPSTGIWTTMAAQQIGREYHSTALLLPDGRVLVAGGGQLPGSTAVNETNAEIYSPPYLFKGARPVISSAPSLVQYGSSFTVSTPDAAGIASVALIRTGAVTHALDMNQRYIPLTFTAGSGALTVQAPSSGNAAPPGYYMLFIVNGNGVPSVASFVRFPAPWEDTQAPTAPSGLTATGGAGSASLSWSASTDNVGVSAYDVYRSTVSGFTPSSGNQIARVTTTSYADAGLAAGTYYYAVRAEDAAGNISAASSQASATATPGLDTTPPTVAITAPTSGAVVSNTITISANAADNVGVAGVQFKLDGADLGAELTSPSYQASWNTTSAADGSHALTAVARDAAGNVTTSSFVSVTVSNAAPPTLSPLLGDQAVEPKTDSNVAGAAEAYKTTATATGTLTSVAVYVDPLSAATTLVAGVYTDAAGHPGALLAQGQLTAPAAGWNTISVPPAAVVSGGSYWVALLAPSGAGTLRFRDRCCGSGSATEMSATVGLTSLQATWARGSAYKDGPVSAYGLGTIP